MIKYERKETNGKYDSGAERNSGTEGKTKHYGIYLIVTVGAKYLALKQCFEFVSGSA